MRDLFKRLFKAGWISFKRNGGQNAATIFIMALLVFLVSTLFILNFSSKFLISEIEEKADVSVYFKKDISEDEILKVKEELSQMTEVKKIDYVSKEKALEKFSQRYKENPVLMESLTEVGENPFLASLNIKSFEASQYEAVAEFLKNPNFESKIEKVDYYQIKPIIEKIFSITAAVNKVGIISSLFLGILAVLVAFNTIRLAIYNSREEIKIQRLVGASNWFIRGPFLIQGAICGLFAMMICLFIFTLICWISSPKIAVLFPGLNIFNYFTSNFFTIFLTQLATGIGVGVFSSLIAIRKYLRV